MRSLAWVGIIGLGAVGLVGTACTTSVSAVDDDGASGGKVTSTGGASASGGRTSSTGGAAMGSGGRSSGSGGKSLGGDQNLGGNENLGGDIGFGGLPDVCCLAIPTCDPGDREIKSLDDCPKGEQCYRNAICCSEVFCVDSSDVTCDAIPTCLDNEQEVPECPKSGSCEVRTLCGTTIYCVPKPATCNPKEEYNRDYKSTDPEECKVMKFACPDGTDIFMDECGCGCEQPSDCPRSVNCQPGSGKLPELCNSKKCPFTERWL